MARREVKVPLARLWILLSYRERSERFCRSWKASGLMQLILLAFRSLWAEPGPRGEGKAQHQTHQHVLDTFLGAKQAPGIWPSGCPLRTEEWRPLPASSVHREGPA